MNLGKNKNLVTTMVKKKKITKLTLGIRIPSEDLVNNLSLYLNLYCTVNKIMALNWKIYRSNWQLTYIQFRDMTNNWTNHVHLWNSKIFKN